MGAASRVHAIADELIGGKHVLDARDDFALGIFLRFFEHRRVHDRVAIDVEKIVAATGLAYLRHEPPAVERPAPDLEPVRPSLPFAIHENNTGTNGAKSPATGAGE